MGDGSTSIAIDSTGVALLTLASTLTGTWLPGRYDWVALAIDSTGSRTTLAQGSTVIEPDPTGAVVADPRSYNRRMLDQIRAVRQGKALDDVSMYKIGGRELTPLHPRGARQAGGGVRGAMALGAHPQR